MKIVKFSIGAGSIVVALVLTIVAANLYNSNLSFIWGVFVALFVVSGCKLLMDSCVE